jgi:hypothetical protein
MADLRTQLRAYVEATVERVDAGDVAAARAVAAKPARERRWWRQPVVVALAASVVVLLLIGGVALLDRWGRQETPVVTTTGAPTTTIPPSTTVAPTTTQPTTTTVPTTTTTPAFPAALQMTWTRVPHQASFEGGWIAAATTGGPGIVAVGGATAGADAAVWLSTDGSTWERIASATFRGEPDQWGTDGDQFMADVAVGPRGLVAVGGDTQAGAAVWVSPDGRTWTRAPHDQAVFGGTLYQFMHAVTAGGPGLVAVGEADQRSAIWASPDGTTWNRVFVGEEYEFVEDVVTWGGRLYAVGYTGWVNCCPRILVKEFRPRTWVSDDGLVWESLPDATAAGGPGVDLGPSWPGLGGSLSAVTVTDGALLALGSTDEDGALVSPAMWRSTDGEAWAMAAGGFLDYTWAPHAPTALLAQEGRLVVALGEGTIWGSTDGGTIWHQITAFEMSSGATSGGELFTTGAPWAYEFVNDLLAVGPTVIAFGADGIWSGTEDIGGATCSWDPGDGSAGQCRTDAAVWVGTWHEP